MSKDEKEIVINIVIDDDKKSAPAPKKSAPAPKKSILGSILGALIDTGTKSKQSNDLEDWQQELVNQGLYDETSFDESEELEEDDYHYEDD